MEFTMPKKPPPPPPYPPEYRRRLIELVRAGRSPDSLAKDFEPTAQTIRNWVKQADLDEGTRTDGLTSEERKELSNLRREVKVLREEKEILKKAAAWFAGETTRTPPKRSGS
jgi:transposase